MSVMKFTQINRDKCYPLFENGRFRGVIVTTDVEEVVRCRDCLHHKPLAILEGGHNAAGNFIRFILITARIAGLL